MTAKPLRVLIVDDNADAARMLCMLLKRESHDARVACDGPAAIAAAGVFWPDVVLLDLTLPGMSGVEVADALRRMPELSACRIAAVTGHGKEALPSPSPFDHYFQKPVSRDALLGYLDELHRLRDSSLTAAVV